MSALGLDDVNDPRGVLAYAPRKPRHADDESTIRPVLERLSRSEGRTPGPRHVRKLDVQELPQPQADAVASSAFPMTARLAVAAGVLALVGAAAAGYMPNFAADHVVQAPATGSAPTSLPKPVQTVSIQRPAEAAAEPAARIVKDDARMLQPAADRNGDAGASVDVALPAPMRPVSNDPSIAPLKAWSAVAAEGSGWSTPPAPPTATDAQAAADEPAKPQAQQSSHKAAPARHARHAARQRVTHHRRHRTARAQAAPRGADRTAQPAESEPAQTQAVKKLPLQAAIDRMFGGSSAGASQQPQQSQQQ